jgi:DNA (cytosine-5)-methyltransferase 1
VNYLDLFSGIGGFALGFKQAGFQFNWHGHSENDKYAEQIYHQHFPDSECLGDVRTITIDRLPKINILTFGFPCQDLSMAGKRKGLYAKRSSLFFEAMRIIRHSQPEVFIFENVKGLFSSGEGRDFEIILRTIADIGLYECEWQLVNTRWFLPQNRERIYFIGHLGGKSRPKVFPVRKSDKRFNNTQKKTQNKRTWIRSISSRYYKDGSEALIQIGHSKDKRVIRRLTPVECERLQGFPDNWTATISDTQRYKTLGNAVTVNVVKAIAKRLLTNKEKVCP